LFTEVPVVVAGVVFVNSLLLLLAEQDGRCLLILHAAGTSCFFLSSVKALYAKLGSFSVAD